MGARVEKQLEGAMPPSVVSRRTLIKGAAWSVPIIVLATATPAAAGSVTYSLLFSPSNGSYATKKAVSIRMSLLDGDFNDVNFPVGAYVTISNSAPMGPIVWTPGGSYSFTGGTDTYTVTAQTATIVGKATTTTTTGVTTFNVFVDGQFAGGSQITVHA